jgi:hypothetical protein
MNFCDAQCRNCGQSFLWLSGNSCDVCSECQRNQDEIQGAHQDESADLLVTTQNSLTQLRLPGFDPEKRTDWWLL